MSEISRANARSRGRVLWAVAAVAAVAMLTLAPRTIVAPARGAFMRWTDAVVTPLLTWIPDADAEQALNTILFVPLGAAVALLLHRRLWPLAILFASATSASVEYAQRTIPGRVPDPHDILWNTVGASIGVLLITIIRVLGRIIAAAARRPVAQAGAAAPEGRVTRT